MTTTPILIAACGPLVAGVAALQVAENPWWLLAIVAPLAGFSAWLVKWIIDRQDERDKLLLVREQAREKREDDRQEAFVNQVGVLGTVARELQLMNDNHKHLVLARQQDVENIIKRIDDLPALIVKKCNGT